MDDVSRSGPEDLPQEWPEDRPKDWQDEGRERPPFTARELAMIAEAEELVRTEGTIPAEEVHAWVDSLFTSHPLPMPEPRKPA